MRTSLRSLLFLFYFLSFNLDAQSPATPLGQQVTPVNPGFEAPAIVSTKFSSEYPNTPATWKGEGDRYFAEFVDKTTQTKKIVALDNFGNILYTRTEVPSGEIPKPITKYFRTNYPDEKVTVWKEEREKATPVYFTPLKKDTLRFDEQGKRLR